MIGAGYVGLVSGACFADLGNNVYCVDKDKEKIDLLNSGEIPIYEPGLSEIVRKNYLSNRLKFTNDLGIAVRAAPSPPPVHDSAIANDSLRYSRRVSTTELKLSLSDP